MIKDFHMHSLYSDDGEYSPKELCQMAKDNGISQIALTDHDSVHGVSEMIEEGTKLGLKVIPGIEVDCSFEGTNFHLLVYHMDYRDPRYEDIKQFYLKQNQEIAMKQVELLESYLHIHIDRDALKSIEKNGVLVPEDIGELLLELPEFKDSEFLLPYRENGNRCDNPFLNIYLDFFSQGKPAYVSGEMLTVQSVLDIAKETQGVTVVAHPGLNFKGKDDIFLRLLDLGIQGIEVESNYHALEQTKFYYDIAKARNLIMTSGSDFHGKNKPAIKMGTFGCEIEDFVNNLTE
ncbi:PHP domain-containing protein [Anaerorhabdus sp.]|uniref:PHP domain-containing protein n=1 Tax=Anaerorhabdus sp. TaxID=1872524 RepID=UPI002FCB0CF5